MSNATQSLFSPLTIATAPDASKPILESVQKAFGFIPNMVATFANNPTVLQGYLALSGVLDKGSFSAIERQIILIAASVENECGYCVAAHSTVAKGLLKAPADVVAAVRNNTPGPDAKLNALASLVKEIVRERGHVTDGTIERFLAVGYKKEQVMEVLLGIALKTISNYFDHISPVPIDQTFSAESR
jgi:uncharacterized peroxidase-related enzyme